MTIKNNDRLCNLLALRLYGSKNVRFVKSKGRKCILFRFRSTGFITDVKTYVTIDTQGLVVDVKERKGVKKIDERFFKYAPLERNYHPGVEVRIDFQIGVELSKYERWLW